MTGLWHALNLQTGLATKCELLIVLNHQFSDCFTNANGDCYIYGHDMVEALSLSKRSVNRTQMFNHERT